jgi:hypothetical protein
MSFVHVPYDNVRQLVDRFQSRDFLNEIVSDTSNFVLVDPHLYYGSYGGLFYDDVLKDVKHLPFQSSSIGHGVSIVWWSLPTAPFVGDIGLTHRQRYVAVTPELFQRMKLNTIHPTRNDKTGSSYYGPVFNALRIKSESFSNSDSE